MEGRVVMGLMNEPHEGENGWSMISLGSIG